jgi:hypothetical protein
MTEEISYQVNFITTYSGYQCGGVASEVVSFSTREKAEAAIAEVRRVRDLIKGGTVSLVYVRLYTPDPENVKAEERG